MSPAESQLTAILAAAYFMAHPRDKETRPREVALLNVRTSSVSIWGVCTRAKIKATVPPCPDGGPGGSFFRPGRRCWLWFSGWAHRKGPSLSLNQGSASRQDGEDHFPVVTSHLRCPFSASLCPCLEALHFFPHDLHCFLPYLLTSLPATIP